jgi:hypothetical protein
MKRDEYITKEYLDATLEKKFEASENKMMNYMGALAEGFQEKLDVIIDMIKGMSISLSSLTERVDSHDKQLEKVNSRLTSLEHNPTKPTN